MKPVSISAASVRRLVSPEMSRATLSRWTRDAGVKPNFRSGKSCYYRATEVARMLNVSVKEIYDRLEVAK